MPNRIFSLKMLIAFIVSISSWGQAGFSQMPVVAWEKQLNLSSNNYYSDVTESPDGNFIIAGAVEMPGDRSYDIWIIEMNPEGDTLRSQIFENPGNDIPLRILFDSKNGFLIAAITVSAENLFSSRLMAIDMDLSVKWITDAGQQTKILKTDVTTDNNDNIWWLNNFTDTNGKDQISLWKMNPEGAKVAEFNYHEEYPLHGYVIKTLPGGTLVITCQAQPGEGKPTIQVMRVDTEGKLLWKSIIPQSEKTLTPQCLCCSPDNTMLIGGWSGICWNPDAPEEEQVWDYDYSLAKIDQNGKIIWSKQYNREGSEKGTAIAVLPEGNILAAGKCETSFTGTIGPWLLLVDKDGKMIKEEVFKFKFVEDKAARIICVSDGGYLMIGPGYIQSERQISGWIRKLNPLP